MRVLFLDCFSGISGDMTVGALCDLGVKPSTFEWELSKLDIGDFHMHFERRKRQNLEGVKFGIHSGSVHTHEQDEEVDEHGQVHVRPHEHGEHDHEHEHEHDCGHDHGAAHLHGHEHAHDHGHVHDEAHLHEHEHGHSHHDEHEHDHVHDDAHLHGHGHTHSHGDEHEHEHEDQLQGSGTHEPRREHIHTHALGGGRSYQQIRTLIESSDLSDFVRKHALSIFHRVALAEAKIHGTSVEAIAFHEVGALDSIADIVCACVGMEELGVDKVFVSPLADGRGWVDCAHGRFPIPAMATLEILRGIAPVGQIDEPFEFITPTGAAIVAEFGEVFGPMPTIKVEKIGYGLGSRQLKDRPNALRAVLGEIAESTPVVPATAGSPYETDTITQIETNIDDLSPEITGAMVDRLLAAGALDAFLLPVQMKKNRPGVLLTVLCESDTVERIVDLIFTETSSFGVRLTEKKRFKLERRSENVQTPHGIISVKLGFKGGKLLQVAPEFDSCRAEAERTGQPLREIYAAAVNAYHRSK